MQPFNQLHVLLQSITHALPSPNSNLNMKFKAPLLQSQWNQQTELQAVGFRLTMVVMLPSVIALILLFIILHLFESLFLKLERLRLKAHKQGINSPSPSFLLENQEHRSPKITGA